MPDGTAPPLVDALASDPRFRLLDQLGEGGAGVVYRAYDRDLEQEVALKTIPAPDAEELFRLKQEFRRVADVVHPNLVRLHELFVRSDVCFFSMELIRGVDLVAYAAGGEGASFDRLLGALPQLVAGLDALHARGALHRDVKTSNVLVETATGRLVLLDFGLATPRAPDAGWEEWHQLAGTLGYMSPEQRRRQPLSPASDWFGVGAILFEALTGRLAVSASWKTPPRVRSLNSAVPAWLDELVARLLHERADERGDGRTILAALALEAPPRSDRSPASLISMPFVGRERELAELRSALDDARGERPSVVFVSGPSGIGKTELVGRFLAEASRETGARVLAGRCRRHESIPYKALDPIVDGLTQTLLTDASPLREISAEEYSELLRLFPALGRVPGDVERVTIDFETADPVALRRLGARALWTLLRTLARRSPLILWIDDFQWGDADSAALLQIGLREGWMAGSLLILSLREGAASDPVARLAEAVAEAAVNRREIALEPLPVAAARELARACLAGFGTVDDDAEAAVAKESQGSPFFVVELAQHHAGRRDPSAPEVPISELVGRRVDELRQEERRLVELAALAAWPVTGSALLMAASLPRSARLALDDLERRRLLRRSVAGGEPAVRPYHDRIAEALIERLGPGELVERHAELLTVLERPGEPTADPDVLVTHYLGASRPRDAGRTAVTAGDRAAEALAFERAVEMYQIALEHAGDEINRARVKRSLGAVLANSGRGGEAGSWYERAAEDLAGSGGLELDVVRLRSLAGEQFLRSGHVGDGMRTLETAARMLGSRIPSGGLAALGSFLWHRARLALRGYDFQLRRVEVPARDLARMDLIWAAATSTGLFDPTLSAALVARHMRWALDAGEPLRIARAFANEAIWLAGMGGSMDRKADELLEHARELTRDASDFERAWVGIGTGSVAWMRGRYPESAADLRVSVELFRSKCLGSAYEIGVVNTYLLSALAHCGEIGELIERMELERADAAERGDLFGIQSTALGQQTIAWLAQDRADFATSEAMRALAPLAEVKGYLTPHYFLFVSKVLIALYRGDAWGAWETVHREWGKLRSGLFLAYEPIRCELYGLRGRSAAAALLAEGEPPDDLGRFSRPLLARTVAQAAAELERHRLPFCAPHAAALRAALAFARGDREQAAAELAAAASRFEAAGMHLAAQSAQLSRSELLTASEGAELRSAALAWMDRQKVVDPSRVARVYAPVASTRFTASR